MTTYVAVDKGGSEWIHDSKPYRDKYMYLWVTRDSGSQFIQLPKGTIQLLLGEKITWEHRPVKLVGVKNYFK